MKSAPLASSSSALGLAALLVLPLPQWPAVAQSCQSLTEPVVTDAHLVLESSERSADIVVALYEDFKGTANRHMDGWWDMADAMPEPNGEYRKSASWGLIPGSLYAIAAYARSRATPTATGWEPLFRLSSVKDAQPPVPKGYTMSLFSRAPGDAQHVIVTVLTPWPCIQ